MFDSLLNLVRAPRFVLAVSLSTVSALLVAGPLFYRALQVRSGDVVAIEPGQSTSSVRPDSSMDQGGETDVIAAESILTTLVRRAETEPTAPSRPTRREGSLTTGTSAIDTSSSTTITTPTTEPGKPTTVSTGPGPVAPTTFPQTIPTETSTITPPTTSGPTVTAPSTTEVTTTSSDGSTVTTDPSSTSDTTGDPTSTTDTTDGSSSTVQSTGTSTTGEEDGSEPEDVVPSSGKPDNARIEMG